MSSYVSAFIDVIASDDMNLWPHVSVVHAPSTQRDNPARYALSNASNSAYRGTTAAVTAPACSSLSGNHRYDQPQTRQPSLGLVVSVVSRQRRACGGSYCGGGAAVCGVGRIGQGVSGGIVALG